MQILVDVTEYAKKNDYSDRRTWWQFSKILENIPPRIIQELIWILLSIGSTIEMEVI